MDSVMSALPVIAILALAAFTRSAIGFGDALLAMPLLALVLDMQTAVPLVAFGASTIAIAILLGDWRSVDLRIAWRLILSSLVGIPVGLYFLKTAPESIVKAILGVVLILFGLYSLIRPKLPTFRSERLAYVFGFIAGILGGAYNTNGPPVVIYATLRDWPPERFRATLQGYFLPTGLMILIGHGLDGLWTPTVLRLFAYSLPFILLAIFLGGKLNQRMSSGQFNRIIYAGLIVMGATLFF